MSIVTDKQRALETVRSQTGEKEPRLKPSALDTHVEAEISCVVWITQKAGEGRRTPRILANIITRVNGKREEINGRE